MSYDTRRPGAGFRPPPGAALRIHSLWSPYATRAALARTESELEQERKTRADLEAQADERAQVAMQAVAEAEALAAEGAKVVMCARHGDELRAAAEPIGALAVELDITEPDAPQRLVDLAVAEHGRLDIVVPNAGGPPPGGAFDVTDEQLLAAVPAEV